MVKVVVASESPSPAGKGDRNAVDEEDILRKAMIYKYNKKLVPCAQKLRKEMTKEERHLWYDFLKRLPLTVNRQKNIGSYIVDFFVSSKRIVIEIDGSQHGEEEQKVADAQRDFDLKKLGISVLRYTNHDINTRFNTVCGDILKQLNLTFSDLKSK